MQQAIYGRVVDAIVGSDPRSPQFFSTPAGESGQVATFIADVDGGAYALGPGKQLQLVVTDALGNVALSKQGVFLAARGGAYFPLEVGDTLAMSGGYRMVVWLTDATVTPNKMYQVVLASSTFLVAPALGNPLPPVTVSPSQTPLAQGERGADGANGPPGKLPLYTATTTDGTSQVPLASYVMANGTQQSIKLTAFGVIFPDPGDGGLGECSLNAYFTCDGSGNVSNRGQDAQNGFASPSWAALSQQPAISTRVVGNRVDILLVGAPGTIINWQAVDALTTPSPVGSGATSVGPAGPAGVQGPPGQAPSYSLQTTDGTTVKTFCSYAMAVSSLLVVRLRIAAAVMPNPGDGGAGEYTVESWFVADGSGNITRVPGTEDIQGAGGAASPSFPSTPLIATTIAGSVVSVTIRGAPSTTINWAATDTLTVPTPPGAQGPPGPVGPIGPIGPAGVPLDATLQTTGASPQTLATYPVSSNGYRLIDVRIIGKISPTQSDGGMALLRLVACASGDSGGVPTVLFQKAEVFPLSASWPAGTSVTATASGSSILVVLTGAAATTINWECVDWTTTPPLSVVQTSAPSPPSYNCDLVARSGVVKWRQHERATIVFDGSTDTMTASWPDFGSRVLEARAGAAIGPAGPLVCILSNVTSTGCTVQISDAVACTVDIDITEVIA